LFWLEFGTVVDMLASWCGWTFRMLPRVDGPGPLGMVERV
jgi:hypothetical protein